MNFFLEFPIIKFERDVRNSGLQGGGERLNLQCGIRILNLKIEGLVNISDCAFPYKIFLVAISEFVLK